MTKFLTAPCAILLTALTLCFESMAVVDVPTYQELLIDTWEEDDRIFTFTTRDGSHRCRYVDYLRGDGGFRDLVGNPDYDKLNLGLKVLIKHKDCDSDVFNAYFEMAYDDRRKNGLKYFCPSGPGARDFINDTESDVTAALAGNGAGKTCTASIKNLLSLIPCDPDWPIFTEHGIKWRPHVKRTGETTRLGIASYETKHVQDILWPEIRTWCPYEFLGQYHPSHEGKQRRNLPRETKMVVLTEAADFAEIHFFSYKMAQTSAEGTWFHLFGFDEQAPEAVFVGIAERIARKSGKMCMSLTPHKVQGRPDTGAGTFIHKMVAGTEDRGLNFKHYSMKVPNTFDWIYSHKEQEKKYVAHILEPAQNDNVKRMREGESRFFGRFHISSGLVYDDWDASAHVIPDDAVTITPDMTKYRVIDHGKTNPTACLWGAVDHHGDLYLYREYYKRDTYPSEASKEIIELSGNQRVRREDADYHRGELVIPRYEEDFVNERYVNTLLDGRSIKDKDGTSGQSLGWLYRQAGLYCRAASTAQETGTLSFFQELLRLDYSKIHPYTGKPGRPKVFVLESLRFFIMEIGTWVYKESSKRIQDENPSEKPVDKDNHLMDCVRLMAQIPPQYLGDRYFDDEAGVELSRKGDQWPPPGYTEIGNKPAGKPMIDY